jgi:hypothetical protein
MDGSVLLLMMNGPRMITQVPRLYGDEGELEAGTYSRISWNASGRQIYGSLFGW